MRTLLLATHNQHKCQEIREILKGKIQVISLDDINLNDQIPETGDTFRENARQKAQYVMDKTNRQYDILADDSGLEVTALGGKPGVLSARFAGPDATSLQNNEKLLAQMQGKTDRSARFVTVLALLTPDTTKYYEGEVRGTITQQTYGKQGFGYDPLFIPEGYTQTFAQLPEQTKNQISHRANAIKALLNDILKTT